MGEIKFKLGDYLKPGSHKIALSLPELQQQTNSFSVKNRPGCTPKFIDSEAKELFLHYNVKCDLKTSDPNGHDVKIRFDLDGVTDETTAKNLDVKVSCSCVAPETMVLMADGTEKRIDQIVVGDEVITHKGRVRPVLHVQRRKSLPNEITWQTKAEGYRDPLVLSDDHPLGIVRGHEIRARWERKWIKGHHRRVEDRPDVLSDGVFQWKKPFGLVHREQLFYPRIEWPGTRSVDPNLASLVGYYIAEGSVPVGKPKGHDRWGHQRQCPVSQLVVLNGEVCSARVVIFTLNQNERFTLASDITTKALEYCGSQTRVEIKDHAHKGRMWLTVTVYSAELACRCLELAGRGSKGKQLSPEVLTWDTSAMMALVSAYALGDGYVSDDAQCVFSISRPLISQLSMFLHSIGIWHGWTYHKKKGTKNTNYRLNWNFRQYPQVLQAMLGRMRDVDRERALSRLSLKSVQGDAVERVWGPGFVRSLLKKERVDAPPTFFDLTIAEDESFIANGIVVHNCPAELWYGGQWNLHQRDSLEGEPRPLLTAPTERLDLRGKFVICKHIKACAERILPSVQHNIVNILRKREVEKRKKQQPEPQPRMKKRVGPGKGTPVPPPPAPKPSPRPAQPHVVERDTPATPEEKERVPVLKQPPVTLEPEESKPKLPPIPTIDELDDDTPIPTGKAPSQLPQMAPEEETTENPEETEPEDDA